MQEKFGFRDLFRRKKKNKIVHPGIAAQQLMVTSTITNRGLVTKEALELSKSILSGEIQVIRTPDGKIKFEKNNLNTT